jgi:putative intracellular protease/amidase
MSTRKIVIIGSNATRIEVQGGGTGATGQYLNETVVPAMAFLDAGYDVDFNMPDALRTAGGDVSITPVDFDPYVVEDREVITGQNPRSDESIAERLIQALARVTVTA